MVTRTIGLVYENESHLQVNAESVLEGDEAHKHQLRLADEVVRLEDGRRRYTCPYCLEPLSIRGSTDRIYHFAHPRNPGAECPMPADIERAWLAADITQKFSVRRVQDYAYGVFAPLLRAACPTAPKTLEGREDLRTILSALISLRLGRVVGSRALNLKHLEDTVFRLAFATTACSDTLLD